MLGALAALRLAESCGLRVTDVDFMRGIVFPRVRYPAEELKTVQARLRHGSARTTLDTYSHLWPDKDESTKAVIDAVVDSKFRGSCGLCAD